MMAAWRSSSISGESSSAAMADTRVAVVRERRSRPRTRLFHEEGRSCCPRFPPGSLQSPRGWACPRHVRGWHRHEGQPRPRGVDAQEAPRRPGPCNAPDGSAGWTGVFPKGAQADCTLHSAPSAALLRPSAPSLPLNRAPIPLMRRDNPTHEIVDYLERAGLR